jgi:hypothetical protein
MGIWSFSGHLVYFGICAKKNLATLIARRLQVGRYDKMFFALEVK